MLIKSLAKSILGKLASFSVELASKYVVAEIKAAKYAKKDLKIIADKIEAICAVLEDAEEKGYSNKRIKVWLRDLKRVLYDIDDLLDEVAYDAKLRKVNEGRLSRQLRYYASSSNPIISRFSLSHKIKHLREKLDNVLAKKNDFGLDERRTDHSSLRDETRDPLDRCPFVHKPTIFGREEAKQYILAEVYGVGDATELSVLPIMGMGGIGKTTLAKLVYDDVKCFDLKLWACVSDKFQIHQLIEDIVKSGKGDVAPNQDLNTLVEKLQDLLKDQKYFLVLDDVWENDVVKWRKLKNLLPIGRAGSVILITTREDNVAYITKTSNVKPYDLQKLPEDVCWTIFKGLAFTEDEEARYPRLYKIGESIIKKCCGIPLVVITLGSLLRRERDHKKWQEINEMDSFVQLDQHYEKVIQILKLSYDKLSSKLKSCFALLSLYPKDSELYATQVYTWSALGLLQVRNDQKNEIEEYGYSYLMDLVSRSLIDEDSRLHIDKLSCSCKMHDFLHDLARKILEEDLSDVTLEKLAVSEFTMHIVWGYEEGDPLKDTKFPKELQNAKNARTFRFSYKMHHLSQSILKGVISHFSCLRILALGNGWFEKLPKSIGKLKHLRYLDLSYNPILRSLPNTICELLNLEYLNFVGCEQLKEIPKDVFQLQSLRYLGVATCEMSLVDAKLNKLTSLHTLVVKSCKRLESLWESGDVGGLTSLRKLNIVDCPKLKCLPNSMKFLINLQLLMISNCKELEEMEEGKGLQGLQSLRYLTIKGVPKMKNIPYGIQSAAASLEYLYIVNVEGLVQLPEWLQHFSSLRRIIIDDCPNLLSLPTGFRHLQSLQQLWIGKCPHLSEKCAEYEGEDYPLIKHIPEVELDGVLFKGAKISINE